MVILCFSFFFGVSAHASASSRLYIEGGATSIAPQSKFEVTLYIDTDTVINAFNIEIGYPADTLKFLSFNNASSIVDLWQTQPKVLPNGNIGLSGGIFRPWSGQKGKLIKLSFSALHAGEANLSFAKKGIYAADGKGTRVVVSSSPFPISIKENATAVTIEDTVSDSTPPELNISVVKNPSDGVTLIIFTSKDIESGVKETQIRFKKWFEYGEWIVVENPVVYPDGVWQIQIKSINNSNVENLQTVTTRMNLAPRIFVLIVCVVVLVYFLRRRYNKSRRAT